MQSPNNGRKKKFGGEGDQMKFNLNVRHGTQLTCLKPPRQGDYRKVQGSLIAQVHILPSGIPRGRLHSLPWQGNTPPPRPLKIISTDVLVSVVTSHYDSCFGAYKEQKQKLICQQIYQQRQCHAVLITCFHDDSKHSHHCAAARSIVPRSRLYR